MQRLRKISKRSPDFPFLLSLVIAVAGMMVYITDIKSDARNNGTEIEALKQDDKDLRKVDDRREIQYDAIMIMLTKIEKDIESLNDKK